MKIKLKVRNKDIMLLLNFKERIKEMLKEKLKKISELTNIPYEQLEKEYLDF